MRGQRENSSPYHENTPPRAKKQGVEAFLRAGGRQDRMAAVGPDSFSAQYPPALWSHKGRGEP